MPEDSLDILQYALQLPIVGLVVWLVFKFIGVMKEERDGFTKTLDDDRKDFLGHLDKERDHRTASSEKLDTTLTGLTTTMTQLTHAVTEVRGEVKDRDRG